MHCTLGTAGHIDHGKTSLVKALTGIDTARLPEEKERGLTIDLGFARLEYPPSEGLPQGLLLAVVDVPGHERFIRNMLAGATGIDMALFAVAGDDGVMPQTIEHLDIVRLLGIESVVFAITKSDVVSRERIERVREDISALVERTALKGSPMVPVSSVTGEGVEGLKTLLLEKARGALREKQGVFQRLPVDRSFAIKGFGVVVTGTIASGVFKAGDELCVFPSGLKARVRGIESHYSKADSVGVGERAALNVAGVQKGDIRRGDVIAGADIAGFACKAMRPRAFDAAIEFLPSCIGALKRKNRFRLFHLTSEMEASVEVLGLKGEDLRAYARVTTKEPVLMLRGDCFILRDTSANRTVGGGRVLAAHFSHATLLRPSDIDWQALESGPLSQALDAVLRPKEAGIGKKTLGYAMNVPEGDIERAPGLIMLGGFAVPAKRFEAAKGLIVEKIRAHHEAHPSLAGAGQDVISEAIKARINPAEGMLDAIIGRLCAEGVIEKHGAMLSIPGHRPRLAGKDSVIEERLLGLFAKGYEALDSESLKGLPFKREDSMRVLAYLVKSGAVVRIKEDRFMAAGALSGARKALVEEIGRRGRIKASEFRDIIGCGRRLAVEMLEYFDRERVTLRQGDYRVLR